MEETRIKGGRKMITEKLEKDITRFLHNGISGIFTDFAPDRASLLEDSKCADNVDTEALAADILAFERNYMKRATMLKILLEIVEDKYGCKVLVTHETDIWDSTFELEVAMYDDKDPFMKLEMYAEADGQLRVEFNQILGLSKIIYEWDGLVGIEVYQASEVGQGASN